MDAQIDKPWYKTPKGILAILFIWPILLVWWIWKKSKWSQRKKIGATAALGFLILVVGALGSPGTTSPTNTVTTQPAIQPTAPPATQAAEPKVEKPAPATYRAVITSHKAVDPATMSFTASVTNTSQNPGVNVSCDVVFESKNSTYRGYDLFDLGSPISPGETKTFSGLVTIEKEGAAWVTAGGVDCS